MTIYNKTGAQVNKVSICPFKPLRKPKISVSNEVMRMIHPTSLFVGTYPKKCTTDDKKVKFLKDGFFNRGVPFQIYMDLVEDLNVSEEIKFDDVINVMRGIKE